MATLTTSWQSYASASYTASAGAKVTFYLEARYSSQNTANNTTTVYTRLRSTISGGTLRGAGYSFTCTYCDERSGTGVWTFENEVIISSPAKTITHNSDGTKSLSLSASAKNTYWNINKSLSATVDLPKINRLAIVTSASDFTDEENPTLSFNNPAGFTVYPYLNFYDNNNNLVYQLYRNSETITSPYTWNITGEERSALWRATNKQQTYKVNVGVDTYNGTTKLGNNSKAQTMTYVNAKPSQSTVFTETNQKVIDVLGNSNADTIIQNVSQLKLVSTPTVKKSATVSKILFEHNNLSVEDKESPYEYTFTVINSKFKVTIVDSRGYSIPTEYTKSIIEYTPIDITQYSFKRYNPTSSDIVFNAKIKYKQTTFKNTANVPTIKWKVGEQGTLNTISSSDYTIDNTNDTITITNLVLSNVLSYQNSEKMYLYVNDLLTEDTEYTLVTKGIPTFDAGEHDFQINGDLFVADTNRQNPVNVLDAIFYKSGDTLQIPSMQAIIPGAYITSGKTEIYFNIYTPKLMTNINKITVTNLQLTARQNGGYILGSGDGGVTVNVTTAKATDNCIRCLYKSSSAISNATNNSPVGLVLSSGTITFTHDVNLASDEEESDLEII